jgi:hypothetical protein
MKMKTELVAGLLAVTCATKLEAQQAAGPSAHRPAPLPAGPDASSVAPPAAGNAALPHVRTRAGKLSRRSGSPSSAEVDGDNIVVAGRRPRGSVVGDIPPERTFLPNDIRAFGTDNIDELLSAIGPQVASARGQADAGPVTLLNGRRISSFAEIARIPTEAIERMEIFPEEVALKYGYRADQKVVNVVTFQRYRSGIGQVGVGGPTDGGGRKGNSDADFLLIRNNTRYGLGATYARSTIVLESDRDVRQISGAPEAGRARTLLPSTEQLVLNGVVSGPVGGDATGTLNGRFERNRSESLLGPGATGPLRRNSDEDVAHVGTTLGGRVGQWQWTALGNYDRVISRTLTDLGDPTTRRDDARSISSVANADLILSGPIARLPAGPLSATVRGGVEFRDFDSRSIYGASSVRSNLGRDSAGFQLNVDLPLLGSVDGGTSRLGRLSANGNIALASLSEAGNLRTFGYGLNWTPTRAISVILSDASEQEAPTLDQLGGPLFVTPNVRTFDLGRGEVVDITQVSGGIPRLRNDDRHVFRLGLNIRPLARTDLTFNVSYVATSINDPITAFPILTPQLEAAFPSRFVRDQEGRLQQIDTRPVNFAESRQKQLRWGFNLTRPLGPVPADMQDGVIRIPADMASQMKPGPDGSFTFTPEPGGAFARNLATAASRVFVSLYHNWYFKDSLRLRDGLPLLDLLDGGAIDSRGGRRRHEVELVAGAAKRGLGGRLSASWRSGTDVGGADGARDRLHFESLAKFDLNLFVNLAERVGGGATSAWLKGTRLTLNVTNLFNARTDVRDRLGATPLSYQPAYLDPLGRTFSLRLRKVL